MAAHSLLGGARPSTRDATVAMVRIVEFRGKKSLPTSAVTLVPSLPRSTYVRNQQPRPLRYAQDCHDGNDGLVDHGYGFPSDELHEG